MLFLTPERRARKFCEIVNRRRHAPGGGVAREVDEVDADDDDDDVVASET